MFSILESNRKFVFFTFYLDVQLTSSHNESNGSSDHVTSFNKPDWLTASQYNTLLDMAGKFPLFENTVNKLATSQRLYEEFYRHELDVARVGKISDVPDASAPAVTALATMVLRPDLLYQTLRNWAVLSQSKNDDLVENEDQNGFDEFQDSFEMMTTFDSKRPILILKDSGDDCHDNRSDDGNSESYLSVLKKLARVSLTLHTFDLSCVVLIFTWLIH